MYRPSTTCRHCGAKLSQRPQGMGQRRAKRDSARSPVQVTLTFLPGAEPWCRIQTGELDTRRPATMAVWELILWLNGYSR